ncbi:hypothetical protein ACLOJK_010657 [Asimina triloba]
MATFNNMSPKADEGGMKERRVRTGQKQRTREVEVIHQHHPTSEGAGGGGGVVAGAAAAMANTIQSVKDALAGKNWQKHARPGKKIVGKENAEEDAGGKQQGLQKGKEKLVEPPPEEDESVGPYYFGEDDFSFESIDLDDEGFEPVRKSEKPISFKDSNLSNPQLAVGMQFKSIRLLRTALVEFTIRGHFDIYYIRNESRSVIARCKVEGRQWKV